MIRSVIYTSDELHIQSLAPEFGPDLDRYFMYIINSYFTEFYFFSLTNNMNTQKNFNQSMKYILHKVLDHFQLMLNIFLILILMQLMFVHVIK